MLVAVALALAVGWSAPLSASGGQPDRLATVAPRDATTNHWTGGGVTPGWSEPANWLTGVPAANQHAAITQTVDVVIDQPTAPLASFTMTAGTLIFTNWTTCLRATDIAINGGTLTLPPPFVNAAMSNRVNVQCAKFSLRPDARIDVTGRGFAGGIKSGNGPGRGTPGSGGGSSYGGTRLAFGYPATYGSARAPTDPGSGGGSLGHSVVGGAGGGAVRIEATGTVDIRGSILANGTIGSDIHGSGGTGGGIFISCSRFEGTSAGLLSACGARGRYSARGGSGGRIAVVYDMLAQAGYNPGVRFAAAGGHWAAEGYGQVAYWPDRRCNEPGTLYCSDASFLSTNLGSGQFKGVTFQADNWTAWSPPSLTVSNGTAIAFYHEDGFKLNVPGAIRVDRATLGVHGPGALACGGDLTLTGTSQLRVYSASTNAWETGSGECVAVAGRLAIGTGSKLHLISHQADGSSVGLRINSLAIAPGGGIATEQ
jgi:hypothetical protein